MGSLQCFERVAQVLVGQAWKKLASLPDVFHVEQVSDWARARSGATACQFRSAGLESTAPRLSSEALAWVLSRNRVLRVPLDALARRRPAACSWAWDRA
jgi:hypothetical protein